MGELQWQIKSFEQLTVQELYAITALREQVFIVEQECVFLDADGLDKYAMHIFKQRNDASVFAYLRVLPNGYPYNEPSIGRIVVAIDFRGQNLGKELVKQGILYAQEQFPQLDIRIAAQVYLEAFYISLGFKTIDSPFILDGIYHQYMLFKHS